MYRYSLLFGVSLCLLAGAAGGGEAGVREALRSRVERIDTAPGLVIGGEAIASAIVLPALYRQNDYALLWENPASAGQLLAVLAAIHEDGLDPADYHYGALLRLQEELAARTSPGSQRLADYDLLLTDSLIRLGYHLLVGKVDPAGFDQNWNMGRSVGALDAVQTLAQAIAQGSVDRMVQRLRPRDPLYDQLRQALAHYRQIAAQGGWPTVPAGPALKPGMRDPRVGALRRRLALSADPAGIPASDPHLYDAGLEAAVLDFQRRHGLAQDAIVGPATLRALNTPVTERIDQLRVNLERARWILHDLPDDYVLVDIAGYRVSLVRGGEVAWEARAVVGKPYRKTPVFRSRITYLELNPTWTIPPTILRKDILPAVRQDPDYLKNRNMRVLEMDGREIDMATIDWSQYAGSGFPYLIRQDPGPENALGRIKFMFPNKYSVYLHDTPGKSLFEKNQRAFSSGCIRVENPYQLAQLLLDDPVHWSQARIRSLVDSGKTRIINLERPVTILLLYWTTGFDDEGAVIFRPDIYQRDALVLAGLNQPFMFPQRPVIGRSK